MIKFYIGKYIWMAIIYNCWMYLLHNICEKSKFIKTILDDGYLRSSYKTKNVKMYGQEKGSQFIYLRI